MSDKKEFFKKVAEIQRNLKAPKGQYNNFGKYKYRSCEDILEGVNKILGDLVITLDDDVVMVGDRIYIKATAKITDGDNEISNSALARESLSKKGMDDSQITGTASSYARKYALNGLLCIDDTKDADTDNYSKAQQNQRGNISKPVVTKENKVLWDKTVAAFKRDGNFDAALKRVSIPSSVMDEITKACKDV